MCTDPFKGGRNFLRRGKIGTTNLLLDPSHALFDPDATVDGSDTSQAVARSSEMSTFIIRTPSVENKALAHSLSRNA